MKICDNVIQSVKHFGQHLTCTSHSNVFGFLKNILFIYLFLAGLGLCCCTQPFSSCGEQGLLCCSARASHCSGFSCCRAQALGMRASVVAARGLSSCGSRALERRLSSCGAPAQLLCGMWDLPGPGLKPMSPALAGRFLITVPPGKSSNGFIFNLDKVPFFSEMLLRKIFVCS